jgi:hypothetical protein
MGRGLSRCLRFASRDRGGNGGSTMDGQGHLHHATRIGNLALIADGGLLPNDGQVTTFD